MNEDQQEKLVHFLAIFPMENDRAIQFLRMCEFNVEVSYIITISWL